MSTYSQHHDKELLSLLKLGDEEAFNEIYKRFWDKIYVVAYQRLKDEPEAEEVVQDVFYSLWKRRASLEIKYSLITYLSVATKYQVINKQTREYQKSKLLATGAKYYNEAIDSTQLWFSEKELKQQLDVAIAKLPEKCRIIFLMSREQEISNKEIATQLGVSEKNIEAHITRALKILKKSLQISLPFIIYLLKK